MEPIRRAEAVNAALECICEQGLDNLTLDKVAAKAGFSKGIAAYYFKTKQELIAESMRAFLSAYRQKIAASLSPTMTPQQMLHTVVDVSLPSLNDSDDSKAINVSTLEGADKITLPEKKIAKLFIQFFSKATLDETFREQINSAYTEDIEGIAHLIRAGGKPSRRGGNETINESTSGIGDQANEEPAIAATHTAYGLLAMIVGLSFFRVIAFPPPGLTDNQAIAFDYMNKIMDN
jgi:TetR/AcrR family transcriptional repressor of bet genes